MKNLTVAKRYAEALYQEAKAEKVLNEVAEDMRQLAVLTANREFGILINNATLNSFEVQSAVGAIYKKGFISKLTYAFLTVLAGKRRINILPQAIDAFAALIRESNSEVLAEVVYASKVGDSVKTALAAQLKKIARKNVILKEIIDPSLLGGLKVTIGSTLYDASLLGRISAMKALLS
ncbi:MAG: ATP synthase F1 subunit delta [Deferribacteraceae bacterium]|nr:ATP synthase F1 subunit delta [Deferribacteraceae bacterium]